MLVALAIVQLSAVTLPYPFLEYCARTHDPGCIVEQVRPEDLAWVNYVVNTTIQTVENPDPDDPWTPFPPDRKGDCDDATVTSRQALLALGVNPRAMTIETGEVTEASGRVVNHMVLIVTLGDKRWVLDRRTPDRVYSPEHRPYEWRPLARQTPAGALWIREDDVDASH